MPWELAVVVPKGFPGLGIGSKIVLFMGRLRPDMLVTGNAIPVKRGGHGERVVVLHVPAVCRDIEPGPLDPAGLCHGCRRQGERLCHIFVPPVRRRVDVHPEVAGHRAGLHRGERESADPFVCRCYSNNTEEQKQYSQQGAAPSQFICVAFHESTPILSAPEDTRSNIMANMPRIVRGFINNTPYTGVNLQVYKIAGVTTINML